MSDAPIPGPVSLSSASPRGPRWASITGYVAVTTGLLVLTGWALDIGALKHVLPGAAWMKPNTAIGIIGLGIAVLSASVLTAPHQPTPRRLRIARGAASVSLFIGAANLLEYLTGMSFGIDLLFFRDSLIAAGGAFPGRISPATSTSLTFIGTSILLLDARNAKLRAISQWPAVGAAVISFVAVLGYLYGADQLYRIWPYATVAFHTALIVVALAVATVLVRPDRPIARELSRKYLGGLMARRILPLAILMPMIVGWLALQGQRAGWYETEVALAFFAAANIVLFSAVIWFAARTINGADIRLRTADASRMGTLRAAEARWRALIEASAQIVWTAGPDVDLHDSPSMRAFTGQTAEQLRVDGLKKVVHPEDWARKSPGWTMALNTRQTFETEFRLRHKDHEWRWVSLRAVPVASEEDPDVSWVGMIHDINTRKLSQALTEGQRHVLELIARDAPITETLDCLMRLIEEQAEGMFCSVLLLDADGRHLRHGAAPSLPTAYTQAIDGAEIGPDVGSCGTAAFTGLAVYVEDIAVHPLWRNFKHLALPHGLRACWSTPITDADGQILGTFAVYYLQPCMPTPQHIRLIELATHTASICISRHNRTMALRESEGRFRQLAESLPQLVWTCDSDGACDYLSQQWLEYTGAKSVAEVGRDWQQQLHPSDREAASQAWATALAEGREFRIELRLRRHDGTYRWFDTHAVPLRDAEGCIIKWIGSDTDIDERKRFEESQMRSQKLESLGTLAGGIAHDFNNMLLVIQGNAQLAQDMLAKDNDAQENLIEITQAAERAADLVRRILAFSRPQKARHKVLQLEVAVDEAVKFARATLPAMVEIRTSVGARVPPVAADATQLHQILLNLITNGAHAIGSHGGRIEIELASVEFDSDAVACSLDNGPALPPGRYAQLTVRDNGCGMSADVQQRIFDPFFTTKPVGQGTGLGLSIVHGIMLSSGGAVTVQSSPGEGTAFHLYFPAAEATSTADDTASLASPHRGGGERVLFIDDEDAVVRLGTLKLARLGYRITGCTDPVDALREFKRDPNAVDIVVTDLSMPGRSGFDCAREMLAIRPDLPILLTSGYVRAEDEATAHEIGIRAVCTKPAALNELEQTIARLLAEAHSRAGEVNPSESPAAAAAGGSSGP